MSGMIISRDRIDLRSDILAPAPAGVVAAMAEAAARPGEFTFHAGAEEQALEARLCRVLGTESAVLFPTCTAANLAALAATGAKGRTIAAERGSHVATTEREGIDALFGSAFAWYSQRSGRVDTGELLAALDANPCVLCLENTHNRLGGQVMDAAETTRAAGLARERGVPVFLDGSRLWNAAVALEVAPAVLAGPADLVSVSFNKGLAASNGAALAGSRILVGRAAAFWRIIGGLLRPGHVLAAAALSALDRLDTLRADHEVAARTAHAIAQVPGFSIAAPPSTNIVLVSGAEAGVSGQVLAAGLAEVGVDCLAFGPELVRLVFHRGVPADAPDRLRAAFESVRGSL